VKTKQRHTGGTHSAGSVQAHPKGIRGKPAPLTQNGRDTFGRLSASAPETHPNQIRGKDSGQARATKAR